MHEFKKLKRLIGAFLDLYPNAEWGPAHVVLSDFNLEDGFITAAITECQAWINATPYPATDVEWTDDHTHEEMAVTVKFLELLLNLPGVLENR